MYAGIITEKSLFYRRKCHLFSTFRNLQFKKIIPNFAAKLFVGSVSSKHLTRLLLFILVFCTIHY